MPRPVLYSANPWLKYEIQRAWRGDLHYVWCSEVWDGTHLSQLDRGSLVAPSANPAYIYRELEQAVGQHDEHCARIKELRTGIKERAIRWHLAGEITEDALQEITAMADSSNFRIWRPVLYIIPRAPVAGRLETVPPDERAGTPVEYRIADLRRDEFDPVEL